MHDLCSEISVVKGCTETNWMVTAHTQTPTKYLEALGKQTLATVLFNLFFLYSETPLQNAHTCMTQLLAPRSQEEPLQCLLLVLSPVYPRSAYTSHRKQMTAYQRSQPAQLHKHLQSWLSLLSQVAPRPCPWLPYDQQLAITETPSPGWM